jgi:hypothetical protein
VTNSTSYFFFNVFLIPYTLARIRANMKFTRTKRSAKRGTKKKSTAPPYYKYYCKSSAFDKVSKDVLDKRGIFKRSIHSSNIALSIIEGWYGELFLNKPRVKNAKVVYWTSLRN